jgi:hypothetical protein
LLTAMMLVVLAAVAAACGGGGGDDGPTPTPTPERERDDEEREDSPLRRLREGGNTPGPTNGPSPTATPNRGAVQLSAGDCLWEIGPILSAAEVTPDLVAPCDDEWVYLVTDAFPLAEGAMPSEDQLEQLYESSCDAYATVYLAPMPDTWEAGDRDFVCLMDWGYYFFSTDVGICYGTADSPDISFYSQTDCALPHYYEVTGTVSYPGDTFPGDQALQNQGNAACEVAFEAYVGIDYEDSIYQGYWFIPSQATWELLGDRRIVCLVGDIDGNLLSASPRGSQR